MKALLKAFTWRPRLFDLQRHRLACILPTTRGIVNLRKPLIPSLEQQAIVALSQTQNVVVSARPGAGKTATAEAIVAANPNRPIALITFSKRLQLETARRLIDYPACDVYTFHGMAGRLFSSVVHNDSVLQSFRRSDIKPIWNGEPYELIILDELQDCTDNLFWLTSVFISAVTYAAGGNAPRIVCLGDEKQAIYEFMGADSRFLSLSSSIMSTLSPYSWTLSPLSKSFRLSHQNSELVNKVFLNGENYIEGSHSGPKPIYMHGDMFNTHVLANTLVPLIRKYGPENTAIIAPHVRANRPLSMFTNLLSNQERLPVAVSISDEVNLDDTVINGKISVSTYHQFKGNERDLVIVYGVDAGYFEYIAKDLPDDTCPNTIFVALTRACKQLVVLHEDKQPPMPFIDIEELYRSAKVVNFSTEKMQDPEPIGRPIRLDLSLPKSVFASQMARHVPSEILDEICASNLEIKILQKPLPESQHIKAPSKVLTNHVKQHYEAVSDLNGLAVVAAYEHSLMGTLNTLGFSARNPIPKFPKTNAAQAVWFCKQACLYEAHVSGYKSRNIQMHDHAFDWLGPFLPAARDRLKEQLVGAGRLEFEAKLGEKDFAMEPFPGESYSKTHIKGRADIIQYDGSPASTKVSNKKSRKSTITTDGPATTWEIKFVAALSVEHIIQTCVYAYLWSAKMNIDSLPRMILFNVKDGEKWEITSRNGKAGLRSLIEAVLRAKYTAKGMLTTEKFLRKCGKTIAEAEGFSESDR